MRVGPAGISIPEELRASRLFVGEYLSSADLMNIKSVSIRSLAISHLLNRSGIERNIESDELSRVTKVSVSVKAQEQIQIPITNAVAEITHSWRSTSAGPGRFELDEVNWFAIASDDPISWELCNESLAKLQDLVSLASDQPVDIQELSMTLHADSARAEVAGGITIYDSRPRKGSEKGPSRVSWSFRLLDGLEIEDLRLWLTMPDRMRSHFRRLFITRGVGAENMYLEDKLNHVVATLQGCGRDMLGDPSASMRTSIRKVFDSVSGPFTQHIPDFDVWYENISERRHELAHHDAGASQIEMTTYLELYWGGYWLCVFALLRRLGVSDEMSERLLRSSWVMHEMSFKNGR